MTPHGEGRRLGTVRAGTVARVRTIHATAPAPSPHVCGDLRHSTRLSTMMRTMETTEMIVSITDHVLMVWPTLNP